MPVIYFAFLCEPCLVTHAYSAVLPTFLCAVPCFLLLVLSHENYNPKFVASVKEFGTMTIAATQQ